MFNNPPKLQTIIDRLISENHVAAEARPNIEATLSATASETETPWYLQGLIGLSGWIAALFFIGFLFVIELVDSETAAIITGVILCAVAVGLRRLFMASIFSAQLALALSLAGQALFILGLSEATDSVFLTVLLTIILEILLILLYPDKLHRFISTLIINGALLVWFIDLEVETLIHLLIILLAGGNILIWQNEAMLATSTATALYRPIGYALSVAVFGILCLSLTNEIEIEIEWWWLSGLGLLLALFYLEYALLSDHYLSLRQPGALWLAGATLVLIIPATQAPGIVAAVIGLLLGFQRGNRLLLGLSTAFLAVFLTGYYYNLDISLLVKSFILIGTGLALLIARYLLRSQQVLGKVSDIL